MIGVGREVAKVLPGEPLLLYPFRFERFATGRPPPRLAFAVPLELTAVTRLLPGVTQA